MAKKTENEGIPSRFPETAPPHSQDFSYLEMVMELQKSMAQMSEKLNNLSKASRIHDAKIDTFSKEIRDKIEGIGKDVHGGKVGVKVAAWLIGIFLTVITVTWAIISVVVFRR